MMDAGGMVRKVRQLGVVHRDALKYAVGLCRGNEPLAAAVVLYLEGSERCDDLASAAGVCRSTVYRRANALRPILRAYLFVSGAGGDHAR